MTKTSWNCTKINEKKIAYYVQCWLISISIKRIKIMFAKYLKKLYSQIWTFFWFFFYHFRPIPGDKKNYNKNGFEQIWSKWGGGTQNLVVWPLKNTSMCVFPYNSKTNFIFICDNCSHLILIEGLNYVVPRGALYSLNSFLLRS